MLNNQIFLFFKFATHKRVWLVFLFILNFSFTIAQGLNYKKLNGSHDVSVPAWGPYTKKYMGISHITDQEKGIRFDLSVMPGFYRQKVLVPNVLYESGYYPWEASADLNYFSFRQELEWKDKVYTDVSFAPYNQQSRIVSIECVNNTPNYQNMVVHLINSINYPEINPVRIKKTPGLNWIQGIDYEKMSFKLPRPQDNLTYDGWVKGEVRNALFVDGNALGKGFGKDKGDEVKYNFRLERTLANAVLFIRYKVPENKTATFTARGLYNGAINLEGNGAVQEKHIPVGPLSAAGHVLELIAGGTSEIELDGFALMEKEDVGWISFFVNDDPVPQVSVDQNHILLKYPGIGHYYGIAWNREPSVVRQFYNDQLDVALPLTVNNNDENTKIFMGNGKGHFTDVFIRPIPLKPNSTDTLYALVTSGSKEEVETAVRQFHKENSPAGYFKKYTAETPALKVNLQGRKYAFGYQIIKANTLQNVVFPVYTSQQYIKHFTPGRWWNSLYTWDSGFIGLGMAHIDTLKAIEILNAYTTDQGDPNAFIHHGSLVPVQFFLLQELWNKTNSKELLRYFYPRLKKYYLFYTGQYGSSTMRMEKSDLIRPWDYFYNSGGWDDYPPQKYIHKNKQYAASIAPVINTAMAIRIARILSFVADLLGHTKDDEAYKDDIALFANSLQKYSWDAASGYFGYVKHNNKGEPEGIFRTKEGVNFNMGMDGAYPLVAGVYTAQQKEILMNALFSKNKLWTSVGLTAVDQSAPYYSNEGYWNGTVWFPHQWFFWKTMLDLGEGDKAAQIALTALNTWEKEAELTYHSSEHFSVETGRGAGWHQFSALSTPVILWFNAYFRPGTLTTGFDGWVMSSRFSSDNTRLEAHLHFGTTTKSPDVLVCLKEGEIYNVKVNGVKVPYTETVKGALKINIPANAGADVVLKVEPQKEE